MKFIRNMEYKTINNFLRKVRYIYFHNYHKKRIYNIVITFFGIIGFIWTLIECFAWIFTNSTLPEMLRSFIKEHLIAEVIIIAIISIHQNRRRLKIQKTFSNTDLTVIVEFCDIFEQEGSIIIPVMDTFDNDVTIGLVNPRTVHGQFLEKYFRNNINSLNTQISSSLSSLGKSPVENDPKLKGKKDRYEIGTCCALKTHDKYFYLSALTFMKDTGNVDIQPQYIYDFLSNVWNFILNHGEYHDTVNIPVIGTGIQKLPANFTHQYIVGEIINSFFATSKVQTCCKTLRICLHINNYSNYDFNKIEILFAHIDTYLNR